MSIDVLYIQYIYLMKLGCKMKLYFSEKKMKCLFVHKLSSEVTLVINSR